MLATSPRRAALALSAFGLLAGSAAHAQEVGFFEALFGRARQPEPVVQQAEPVQSRATRIYSRRHAERPRLRTRYAALPKAEPLKVTITDRQKPLDMSGGAAAALMRDPTLRPGDIVILDGGARVFTGSVEKRHTPQDFQPVRSSRLVDARTKRDLAAMVAPVGALPADEARRQLARLKRGAPTAHPAIATEAQATPATMRVINVWNTVR